MARSGSRSKRQKQMMEDVCQLVMTRVFPSSSPSDDDSFSMEKELDCHDQHLVFLAFVVRLSRKERKPTRLQCPRDLSDRLPPRVPTALLLLGAGCPLPCSAIQSERCIYLQGVCCPLPNQKDTQSIELSQTVTLRILTNIYWRISALSHFSLASSPLVGFLPNLVSLPVPVGLFFVFAFSDSQYRLKRSDSYSSVFCACCGDHVIEREIGFFTLQ